MSVRTLAYGFEWGPVKVERFFSDEKKGWVILGLTTARHPQAIQVYITKTGKVRVMSGSGEWTPSSRKQTRHRKRGK